MSRLDQLAKPRKPLLPALNESSMAPKSSVTRSMSHLAHVGTKLSPRQPLSKADSRSLHHLSPDRPVAPPRVNRATQLRQQKLQMALQSGSTSEGTSTSFVLSFILGIGSSVLLTQLLGQNLVGFGLILMQLLQ